MNWFKDSGSGRYDEQTTYKWLNGLGDCCRSHVIFKRQNGMVDSD